MSRTRKTIFCCCIAVMIVAISVIILHSYWQSRNSSVYENLPDQVVTSSAADYEDLPKHEMTPPAAVPKPAELSPNEPSYTSPIDFETLWEINTDIYAWIDIPGTTVTYPVVQHPSDDAYYLNHTIEGNASLPGSIYTEPSVNGKDFSDYNTIIYGHNMRIDGNMFHDLLRYRDVTFLEENREIILYMPDTEYHYWIFAAVTYSDAYIPYYYPGDTESSRQAYLDSIINIRDMNSHVLTDVEVTAESRLLTLSTCAEKKKRFLIVAVLEENKTSAEEVTE